MLFSVKALAVTPCPVRDSLKKWIGTSHLDGMSDHGAECIFDSEMMRINKNRYKLSVNTC